MSTLRKRMRAARLDAVWAAVYVRVLSTFQAFVPSDNGIEYAAAVLATPTEERMDIAIAAANEAVARLSAKLGAP